VASNSLDLLWRDTASKSDVAWAIAYRDAYVPPRSGGNAEAALRVGADVVTVEEVSEAIARFGDRYLMRLFTPQELSSCQGVPSVRAASLAARYAAKEATFKVLRPAAGLDYRSMEVVRRDGGWCELALHGGARRQADQDRLGHFALSMSHDGGMAAAVVIASVGAG